MISYEFEVEVANLYLMLGYFTKVTKASGDGGVDIILNKEDKIMVCNVRIILCLLFQMILEHCSLLLPV